MNTPSTITGVGFADKLVSSGIAVSANLYGKDFLEMKLRASRDSNGCFKVSGTVEQVRSCISKIVDRFGDETLKLEWSSISND